MLYPIAFNFHCPDITLKVYKMCLVHCYRINVPSSVYQWCFYILFFPNYEIPHRVPPIPKYRYWLWEYSNRYRYPQNPPYRTDTDIFVWYRYICMIPIYLYDTDIQIYDTDIQIYDTDITLKNLYETDIPIPISTISISSIPNRYRYPPYPPYWTDTDTGFIPIFSYRNRYRVSVPGTVSYRVAVKL